MDPHTSSESDAESAALVEYPVTPLFGSPFEDDVVAQSPCSAVGAAAGGQSDSFPFQDDVIAQSLDSVAAASGESHPSSPIPEHPEVIDLASVEDIQVVIKDPNNPQFLCSRGFSERDSNQAYTDWVDAVNYGSS